LASLDKSHSNGGRGVDDDYRSIPQSTYDNRARDLYFGGSLLFLALKIIPVSIAFPSVAASYAVVAVLAHLLCLSGDRSWSGSP
jgi:hypothetical protein